MPPLPRISVVTSSYNQGPFLARTIESVLAQGYPNLEHIVVDGLSTDDTPQVLNRYPHLRVIREKDRGQADAINKGFRAATGAVHCFLNSDDTLCPGALQRVAREIDPARGRHVVQGRCNYIDEDDDFIGREHPSRPVDHLRILQVWRTHCVPQPSTFWTAEVWKRCGPLDETLHLALDYDLFCRFSRCYRFHYVDAVLANYRLHGDSKTCSNDEDEVLEQAIAISRRYWGPRRGLKHWLLSASLAWFRFVQRYAPETWSSELLERAACYPARGLRLRRRGCLLLAILLAPRSRLREFLPRRLLSLWDNLFERSGRSAGVWSRRSTRPETLVWRGFTGLYPDHTIGPIHETELMIAPGDDTLRLDADEVVSPMPSPFAVEMLLDGRRFHLHRHEQPGALSLTVPLPQIRPGNHRLTLRCSSFVTWYDRKGEDDHRPLSLVLRRLAATASNEANRPRVA